MTAIASRHEADRRPRLALLLLLTVPHAAQAAGRADASKVAKRALRSELRQPGARLHLRAKRVPKGATVGQGGPQAQARKVKPPA